MEGLIIALLWLLAGLLSVMMIAQGMSRRVDLFSVRNIYLAGFIVYQVVSPVTALSSGNFFGFRIVDPVASAKWFLIFAYVYIAIYLLSYHWIPFTRWLASKFPGGNAEASDSMLTGLAISLIVASLVARVVGLQVPLLRGLSINVSVAFAAAACAITGWIWGHRRLNPAVLLVVAFVVSISMVIAMTGFYSRRPLISVLAGFAWGAYYRWARNLTPSRLLFATVPLIIGAALVVSAFTAVRWQMFQGGEGRITFTQMRGANIGQGSSDLVSGQSTGAIGFWVMEKYPAEIDYQPLFSLRYMAYYFIPRMLWEEKPNSLSNDVATLARLRGVNRKLITLPPGVIGYAGAEGGFYAIVIYALFFGQFTRFFDELIRLNPTNPFIILSVGCTTGQFLGLARGDMSIFANLAIIGFISTYLILYVTSLAFGRSRTAPAATPWPQMR